MLRTFAIATLLTSTLHAAPRSVREMYNDGIAKMKEGDLKEAESMLRTAAASGADFVLNPALYNLGHIRFSQGKETLKGEGNRQELLDSASAAVSVAEEVLRAKKPVAEQSKDVQEIIEAYMEGRGARKQLRLSRDANTRAMDLLGTTLSKWRRSVGDFRSAAEMQPSDTDSPFNADVVERHIKELLKFKEELEKQAAAVEKMREELKKMMGQLRGKIPPEMMQEGDGEEEDEDSEEEKGKKPKDKTGEQQEQRIGGEREISPEMGKWLKESMKQRTMNVGPDGQPLGGQDSNEPDPLGQPRPGNRDGLGGDQQPKGKKGKDW
jgi:tetratricopeptide (TPR) repeat protein